jgi:hypothetical protein
MARPDASAEFALGRLGHPTSRDTPDTAARTVAIATRGQRDAGATGPSQSKSSSRADRIAPRR